MIFKLFTHVILTTALLQLFPVDARDLERSILTPPTPQVSAAYTVFTLPQAHLPMAKDAPQVPTKKDPTRLGVATSAVSAIVIDRKTGAVLFEKNREAPRSIGSITKLMTALVFLQSNPDLSASASIESGDVRLGGVQHIRTNDEVTVRDLLYASLVSSDNSATASLMRLSHLTSGDFVAKMNEMAATIGMQQTQFVDPTGLSAKNVSVVSDLAKLLDYAASNETIRDATEHATFTIHGASGTTYALESTDQLLGTFVNQNPYHIVAAKTGYLPEAGYCLGTLFSDAQGHEIIAVVLGSDTEPGRFQDVKSMAVWAYDVYQWN